MTKFEEPEKITIIAGPTPYFHLENNAVILSVLECPKYFYIQKCTVRTLDGERLIRRCRDAWRTGKEIYLEYQDAIGQITHETIVAAKTTGELHEQILILWLRIGGITEYDN